MSLSDKQIEQMAHRYEDKMYPLPSKDINFYYTDGAKATRKHYAKEVFYERAKRARWMGAEVHDLVDQIENLEKLLDEWMSDYDKLKEKYEPTIAFVPD